MTTTGDGAGGGGSRAGSGGTETAGGGACTYTVRVRSWTTQPVAARANALQKTNPIRAAERFVAFIVCSVCDDFMSRDWDGDPRHSFARVSTFSVKNIE